jgi:hypothetical protein
VTQALQELGCADHLLQRETMALLSMAMGVLLIHDPTRLTGTNALAVEALAAYLDSVQQRLGASLPVTGGVSAEASPQVDLFA